MATGLSLFLSGFTGKPPADGLCKQNEGIILSFTLNSSKKSACLCKEKTGKYLVYRFGTSSKIELEHPQKLDASSWKAFTLNGQKRFGGKANAGFVDYRLSFRNKEVTYELFEASSDEDGSKELGVKVTLNKKETILKGAYKTKNGTLLRLDDEGANIKNAADEE